MIILADEGVDSRVVSSLRSSGHTVYWVAEDSPGVSDGEVLQRALTIGALLITEDKDFGELVFRSKLPHKGVVLLRINDLSSIEKSELVLNAFNQHAEAFIEVFSVLRSDAIRIRRPVSSPGHSYVN